MVHQLAKINEMKKYFINTMDINQTSFTPNFAMQFIIFVILLNIFAINISVTSSPIFSNYEFPPNLPYETEANTTAPTITIDPSTQPQPYLASTTAVTITKNVENCFYHFFNENEVEIPLKIREKIKILPFEYYSINTSFLSFSEPQTESQSQLQQNTHTESTKNTFFANPTTKQAFRSYHGTTRNIQKIIIKNEKILKIYKISIHYLLYLSINIDQKCKCQVRIQSNKCDTKTKNVENILVNDINKNDIYVQFACCRRAG